MQPRTARRMSATTKTADVDGRPGMLPSSATRSRIAASFKRCWLSGVIAASSHPCGFLIRWHSSVGREMVNHARKVLCQHVEQLLALHAGLLHQVPDAALAKRRL